MLRLGLRAPLVARNKIWHSDHYRNIVSLKKTHKQVTELYLQNNTLTLWKNSCTFSRDLVHETRWTSPLFHHYWCYAVIDHNVVAAGISALIWKKWNSYWYALNIGTPGKTMEMYQRYLLASREMNAVKGNRVFNAICRYSCHQLVIELTKIYQEGIHFFFNCETRGF